MLRQVLLALPAPEDARLLSGFDAFEDAAVFRLDSERALVATIDVITPVVDDAFTYGEIAAANALSDLYAMGGEGLFSLSFLGLPRGFPEEAAVEIAKGGASLAKSAGAPVVGGHSLESKDVTFGLAVVGLVHPERLFRNGGLAPGHDLVLTKPLGTGSLTTAVKNDALSGDRIAQAVEGMRQTNRAAVELCRGAGVRAATDVSGFGLVGHAAEMARASSVEVVIESSLVPEYPLAREMLKEGHLTRGDRSNVDYARTLGPVEGEVDPLLRNPQTSGGLLIGVPASESEGLIDALRRAGYPRATSIGRVGEGSGVKFL